MKAGITFCLLLVLGGIYFMVRFFTNSLAEDTQIRTNIREKYNTNITNFSINEIDGCEYIFLHPHGITHKGNCSNPAHNK